MLKQMLKQKLDETLVKESRMGENKMPNVISGGF